MSCDQMKRHIRHWAERVVSYLQQFGYAVPGELQDIEALLDHVDCELEYDENLNYIFKEYLKLSDSILKAAGVPVETMEVEYGSGVDYDPTYVSALKESLRYEFAQRFLDEARSVLGDFAEQVASAIADGEIAPRGAFEVFYWYRGELPKKLEEVDYDFRELIRLFIREVNEFMAKKSKWEKIVEEHRAVLSIDEQEILLDPTVPEFIKETIIQQKGIATKKVRAPKRPKPKPTVAPTPKPSPPPPTIAPTPKPTPTMPVRPIESALKEALERMGYGVRKILQYYRIGKNVYGVMFIDKFGKTKYHYRVVVE